MDNGEGCDSLYLLLYARTINKKGLFVLSISSYLFDFELNFIFPDCQ